MHQIEIKIRHRLNHQHTFRTTQRHQQAVMQQHHNGKNSLIIVQKAAMKPVPETG